MLDVSRRGFLAQAAVATGVGVAGGLGLHKLLAAPAATAEQAGALTLPSPAMEGVSLAGPMVVHVRNLASGEVAMMVGTQELIYRDPELVAHLVQTAARAGRAEG